MNSTIDKTEIRLKVLDSSTMIVVLSNTLTDNNNIIMAHNGNGN